MIWPLREHENLDISVFALFVQVLMIVMWRGKKLLSGLGEYPPCNRSSPRKVHTQFQRQLYVVSWISVCLWTLQIFVTRLLSGLGGYLQYEFTSQDPDVANAILKTAWSNVVSCVWTLQCDLIGKKISCNHKNTHRVYGINVVGEMLRGGWKRQRAQREAPKWLVAPSPDRFRPSNNVILYLVGKYV